MAGRRAENADDDGALWERVSGTVKPLKRRPVKIAVAKSAGEGDRASKSAVPKQISSQKPRAPAPAREQASPLAPGAAAGLDKRTAQRLRRGQLRIEGRLDLHGMTQAEALRSLSDFLKTSSAAGRRCVLVITGKGTRGGAGSGVLRSELPRWLNEAALRPLVLGFAVAQPKHGGGGAFYVYLRRERAP